MGSLPAHRNSKSKIGRRRSHLALKAARLSYCERCESPVVPHRACSNCGFYKGRMVVDVFKGLSKKERKSKEKELSHTHPHQH